LNAGKTQLIWLGTRQQLAKLTVTQLRLTSSVVEFDSTVTDLGVVLDNQLSMQAQVAAVCRSCFYQLRQLHIVQRSLTSAEPYASYLHFAPETTPAPHQSDFYGLDALPDTQPTASKHRRPSFLS